MNNKLPNFAAYLRRRPDAYAIVNGSEKYPGIAGIVYFYETDYGSLVVSTVKGLPSGDEACKSPIFAFHIHEGDSCSGDADDPFENAGMHYNPRGCPHPYHAGDLPSLLGADGYAFSAFLTDRFTVSEIIGRTVIIHSSPDDFTTQPSGNAGTKLACGEILAARFRR